MPLFRPDNLQGAGSNIQTTLNATTLLLEWGHFIESTPNLLMINGGVELGTNTATTFIDVTLTMDDVPINTRSASISVGIVNVDVGARLENVPVGHHVFKLFALAGAQGEVVAESRSVTSISGSPPGVV